MTDQQRQQLKQDLLDQKTACTTTLDASRQSEKGDELDQQRVGRLSRMDALQSQAMAQAATRRIAEQLQDIDAALERIQQGTYGTCQSCGHEIPFFRLEIYPTTPHCIACANRSA